MPPRMRRVVLIATLLAGLGLVGASLHGFTSVDRTLAAAAPPPAKTPCPEPGHPDV